MPTEPTPEEFPRSGLLAIAVLPALLVALYVFWDARGPARSDEGAPESVASSNSEGFSEISTTGVTGTTTLGTAAAREAATPEPTEASAPAPTALGIPVPELSASAAIVVDDASQAVLYAKDGYSRRPPASVTKIAKDIVTLERGRLDDEVASTVHYWDMGEEDGTTMGLIPGDVLTLRELLYGLMLVSGNDAAQVIAQHIAGSEEAFAAEMNALVARLGLEDTHFSNASGIYAPDHYSSPWDLAMLSRYLMRFPDLREIVGTEEHTAEGTRDGAKVTFDLYNHNPLLNYTPGVDGIKTGFTEEAGRTFAVSVERGGHRVYIVLMDTALRAQDAQALIEWAYENHVWPGESTAEGGAAAEATPAG